MAMSWLLLGFVLISGFFLFLMSSAKYLLPDAARISEQFLGTTASCKGRRHCQALCRDIVRSSPFPGVPRSRCHHRGEGGQGGCAGAAALSFFSHSIFVRGMHLLTRCLGERGAGKGGPSPAPAATHQAVPILGTAGCF